MKVRLADVIRTGPPTLDRNGIVFESEGRIYRALRKDAAAMYRRLLDADWLDDLFETGFVRFWRADIEIDGFDLVLEVERVPIVTYPPEWPTGMLRAAGTLIADLGRLLASHGLSMVDAHPWNVLFDGTRPIFIDLGSVEAGVAVTAAWRREFRRYVVLPLALHGAGIHALGDAIQHSQRAAWLARLDRWPLRFFPLRYERLGKRSNHPESFFGGLSDYLRSGDARAAATAWSEYYVAGDANVSEDSRYNDKQRSVDEILGGTSPTSVLDAGANEGWYSRLAARHGHRVVSLDLDDRALTSLFVRAGQEQLSITPLRMDIMWPPGSSGLGLEYRSAPERLRSHTVIALALLHHLVGTQGMSFGAIARVLDLFAEQQAVVEFIPVGDTHIAEWPIIREPWYTVEAFVEAMDPFFRLTRVLPSDPSPRTILQFQRV